MVVTLAVFSEEGAKLAACEVASTAPHERHATAQDVSAFMVCKRHAFSTQICRIVQGQCVAPEQHHKIDCPEPVSTAHLRHCSIADRHAPSMCSIGANAEVLILMRISSLVHSCAAQQRIQVLP
jgi:hypothetical protein